METKDYWIDWKPKKQKSIFEDAVKFVKPIKKRRTK